MANGLNEKRLLQYAAYGLGADRCWQAVKATSDGSTPDNWHEEHLASLKLRVSAAGLNWETDFENHYQDGLDHPSIG